MVKMPIERPPTPKKDFTSLSVMGGANPTAIAMSAPFS
jgi:hypothetical protein